MCDGRTKWLNALKTIRDKEASKVIITYSKEHNYWLVDLNAVPPFRLFIKYNRTTFYSKF